MKKLIGGIFLISGTAIGGGVVLLPAVIGIYGYWAALFLLISIWLVNIFIAFVFLEANFYLPNGSSMISMTKTFFGKNTQWITWILSLFFLYTLLCAYLSGISDILGAFTHLSHNSLIVLIILTMGILIFLGLNYLSTFNDFVVIGMFILMLILFVILGQKSHVDTILSHTYALPIMALPIVFAAYGFTVIVPSLRIYFNNDIKKLKLSFLIGATIPFVLYFVWVTIIMGIIPSNDHILNFQSILSHQQPVSAFKTALVSQTHHPILTTFIEVFIVTAFASSLTGISIATFHLLADGLKIHKGSFGKIKLLLLIFIPPLLITTTQNQILIKALGLAGLLSTLVFGVFPLLFVWRARYNLNLKTTYKSPFSKQVLIFLLLICSSVIGVELYTIFSS